MYTLVIFLIITTFRFDVFLMGGYLVDRWCGGDVLGVASPYREDRDKVRAR